MSKTVFDHLTEQLDGVVKGRRYIIAEVGKLKVSVEDLRDIVEQSTGGGNNMGAVVNDLKIFMQKTIGTLGELKNTVNQLGGLVKSLATQVSTLKSRGVAAPAAAPAPAQRAPAPVPAPAASGPRLAPAPAPAMPSMPMPTPAPAMPAAPAATGSAAAGAFDRILQAAQGGAPAKNLGGMLDALRTSLSKANPLNPILFELSMEAGRLKSLGDSGLDGSNITSFQAKIQKWKSKS
jgi:hypothetical protein